jgi:asparagine synthase (glutamine-hydrolysing)
MSIPLEYKLKANIRKYIFREFARTLGLPEKITERAKKAAQYGSGIMSVMKKLARKEKLTLSEYLQKNL